MLIDKQTTETRTLLGRLDAECPPFWAYAMATKNRHSKWIGLETLRLKTGIPRRTLIRIGQRISWNGIPINVASAFLEACGFHLTRRPCFEWHRFSRYISDQHHEVKNPYRHLRSNQWQKLNQCCARWMRSQAKAKPAGS